ncbi:3-hydroxyisobutyryl-CoA hydrolase 1 [Datura stramonium]|uniref:3-hydroxyisobutyryl-CoA hydrolase n=1 Tax=Datura stramonium TaxID=4076 RepID=A0ABS8RS04_DATST|nr:3-hydroxyisobutyryl-CoA hydrolase 1 [Datura stramonium]
MGPTPYKRLSRQVSKNFSLFADSSLDTVKKTSLRGSGDIAPLRIELEKVATSLFMFSSLSQALVGNGRAFCAGGDLTAVVHNDRQGNWKLGADYYREEFTLNYVMATYSKPQVSILNGIVMGGGLGVSVHGRFRVATEKSVCAMPETALGLFPDVGASYFYSRLPGFFGEYAGLTGARLDGAEMLACGLATHFVLSEEDVRHMVLGR